jgi:hypothetical protein
LDNASDTVGKCTVLFFGIFDTADMLKHHIFGFPYNAQHFNLCQTLLVIVQVLNVGTRDNKNSFAKADFGCFCK